MIRKIIVLIHTKPEVSNRLERYYLLWLLLDFKNCLVWVSGINDKFSISSFTPLNPIL